MPDPHNPFFLQRLLIGQAMKHARNDLGYSLRELSKRCGVSTSHILRIESGEYDIQLETFMKIAAHLGVPCGLLLEQGLRVSPGYYSSVIIKEDGFGKFQPDSLPTPSAKQLWRLRTVEFIKGLCVVATHLCLSSDPVGLAARFAYPFDSLKVRIADFARVLVNNAFFTDRASIIRELGSEPVEQLEAIHILSPELVAEYHTLYNASRGTKPADHPWVPFPRPIV